MDRTENYKSIKKEKFQRKPATEYRGETYEYCAGFPSKDARDVIDSFNSGIMVNETLKKYIAIEGEVDKTERCKKVKGMTKQLKKKTDKFEVVEKMVHKVVLNKYLPRGKKLEYFGFDICGNFNASIAGWFFLNQKHFADGMRFPMTLSANTRHQDLHRAISTVTNGKYVDVIDKILKNIPFAGPWQMNSEMRTNIASQIFMVLHSMPDKHIDIRQINVYRNSDKSNMASYMVFIDAYVYDSERNIRAYNQLHRIIDVYNNNVKETSFVRLHAKKKTAKKTTKATTAFYYAKRLSIINNNDLVKLDSPGVKAAITRWSKKYNTTPNRIIGGIKRSVSCNK